MIKILTVAALSLGLATSAIAQSSGGSPGSGSDGGSSSSSSGNSSGDTSGGSSGASGSGSGDTSGLRTTAATRTNRAVSQPHRAPRTRLRVQPAIQHMATARPPALARATARPSVVKALSLPTWPSGDSREQVHIRNPFYIVEWFGGATDY
jgi:hypothetical protein